MERIQEICESARKTGFIRLSDLRDVLAKDSTYSREILEKIYAEYNCHQLSGLSFSELISSFNALDTISRESLDTILKGKSLTDQDQLDSEQKLISEMGNLAAPGEHMLEEQPGDMVWRTAVWHWLLLRWANIKYFFKGAASGNADAVLTMYYRSSSGTYENIEKKFEANWHHYIKLSEIKVLFESLKLPLHRLLFRQE